MLAGRFLQSCFSEKGGFPGYNFAAIRMRCLSAGALWPPYLPGCGPASGHSGRRCYFVAVISSNRCPKSSPGAGLYTAKPSACAASTFFCPSSMKSVCAGDDAAVGDHLAEDRFRGFQLAQFVGEVYLVEIVVHRVPVGREFAADDLHRRRVVVRQYVGANPRPAQPFHLAQFPDRNPHQERAVCPGDLASVTSYRPSSFRIASHASWNDRSPRSSRPIISAG